jgi:hypothetical protein
VEQPDTQPTDPSLDPNGVVSVLTPELALLYAQSLALGDRGPLDLLEVATPSSFNPATREWGVGQRENGEHILVIGQQGEVDWRLFPRVLPIAHSHPFEPTFVASNDAAPVLEHDVPFRKGIQLVALINELLANGGVVEFARALTRLLPSNQDVRSNYRAGGEYGQEELLFTPYRFDVQQGILTVAATSPGILVHFGPALGVRSQDIPIQIRGYQEIVSQFIAPVRIGHGPPKGSVELWRGWLSCGWTDQAGMTMSANPPPNHAQARRRMQVEAAVRAMGRTIPDSVVP